MQIAHIPLDQINADILPRDRSLPSAEEQDDLVRSIETLGLHTPIEVFGLETTADQPCPYGLISGYRRLTAFRTLGRDTIPALLHNPETIHAAMAAMVAENEVRSPISPWEKGRFLARLIEDDRFENIETALTALYPSATRSQRLRLKNCALVADTFHRRLMTPERLTQAQIDRLAAALRAGGEEAISLTLRAAFYTGITLNMQMQHLATTLDAIFTEEPPAAPNTPRRAPRHTLTLRPGLILKRERERTGWVIRFYGEEAKSPGLVDDIFDMVDMWLGRRG
ncbi:ParB/RepB/Spo0J family partition protein [Thioclava sp. FR2]|uniref:ParB/RepB/Spo0J family partition protein n=1 Tax=Thioclava sp. FR2 TaxID=3445780 RepID=UPI003EBF234C